MKNRMFFRQLLLMLSVSLLIFACGRLPEKESELEKNSNLFSTDESAYLKEIMEAKASSIPAVTEDIPFDEIEYDEENGYFHSSGDGYHCYAHEMQAKGKLYVLHGNTISIEEDYEKAKKDFWKENFDNIKNLTLASGRSFCIIDLTFPNLVKVAEETNIEYIILVGHGLDGKIETKNEYNKPVISAEDFPNIKSESLLMIDFINYQAGKDLEVWKDHFPDHSVFHIKNKDVSVDQARGYLNSEFLKALYVTSESLNCEKLNKSNKLLLDEMKQNSKCQEKK